MVFTEPRRDDIMTMLRLRARLFMLYNKNYSICPARPKQSSGLGKWSFLFGADMIPDYIKAWGEKFLQANAEQAEKHKERRSYKPRKPKTQTQESEEKKAERAFGYVYILKSSNGYHKIGRAKETKTRLQSWKRFFPVRIRLIHQIACTNYIFVENFLHKKYWGKRKEGEWYKLDKEDIAWLLSVKDHELG